MIKECEIENSLDPDQVIGKKVLSENGEFIGVIDFVQVNPANEEIEGIEVDGGLFSKGYRIWIGFIKCLDKRGAILKVNPLEKRLGKVWEHAVPLSK